MLPVEVAPLNKNSYRRTRKQAGYGTGEKNKAIELGNKS